jgi:hypothetical protein
VHEVRRFANNTIVPIFINILLARICHHVACNCLQSSRLAGLTSSGLSTPCMQLVTEFDRFLLVRKLIQNKSRSDTTLVSDQSLSYRNKFIPETPTRIVG